MTQYTPFKQWKSFDEQLELIASRGMIIDDDDRALAYLRRIGYYRLSLYWFPFRRIDECGQRDDKFVEGTRFDDIVNLYIFDKKLRMHVLDAIERIEMSIRVDVAHTLGKRGPLAHKPERTEKTLNLGTDEKRKKHTKWVRELSQCIKNNSYQGFVKHHKEKYGDLPVWVSIELWTFGMLRTMLSLMLGRDVENIARRYGLNKSLLLSWLESIRVLRNKAAHHDRVWNAIYPQPRIPNKLKASCGNLGKGNSFFMVLLVITRLMRFLCPNSSWPDRTIKLIKDFPTPSNGVVSIADMGAPTDWDNALRVFASVEIR